MYYLWAKFSIIYKPFPFRWKNQSTLRWLVEQVKNKPFNRENDDNYNKRFNIVKKNGNTFAILFWTFSIITLITAAVSMLLYNNNNEMKSKEICQKIYEKFYWIYKESNLKIPYVQQNDIYEKVYLMQKYLNISSNECVRVEKSFPLVIRTPYNNQISPNYEITLLLQGVIAFVKVFCIIPVDLILMSFMMYIRFQFQIISNDLVGF